MKPRIDLVWFGHPEAVPWDFGEVWPTEPNPKAVYRLVQKQISKSKAEAWLFWDGNLGQPDPERICQALSCPGDLWHAGLRLGMRGLPGLIDYVSPTWMLNCDPSPDIEATSWRLSLRACLTKTKVLSQMGGPCPEFQTLPGAALEMGHRYSRHGVLTRHVPWLLPEKTPSDRPEIPFEDELRFSYYCFGARWSWWAITRGLSTGHIYLPEAFKALKRVNLKSIPRLPDPYTRDPVAKKVSKGMVSVLIPTLERYPYLRTLLGQLRCQTVRPYEIIIVDQTPKGNRMSTLYEDFSDLPLKVIYLEKSGQCYARNAGLNIAQGECILFLDDDVEVPPDLIETHLSNLNNFQADVSSGVAVESGESSLPWDFQYIRASDVFPAGNTLINRKILQYSGLFDMAYNRGARADGDLGMRLYLNGAHMILNPDISILHHHAPTGGLRVQKARKITYRSSRHSLLQRHLPSATEIYLGKRYFAPRQVRESLWISALGTFSVRGSLFYKGVKIIISLLLLPHTIWQIGVSEKKAAKMLEIYPKIAALPNIKRK